MRDSAGRAGGRAVAAAGLHLALDGALRRPPVLVEHWEAGASLSSMGEGSGHPRPNPVEFPFLSSVNSPPFAIYAVAVSLTASFLSFS